MAVTAVYLVSWTESERGWGQRPDGYTLHATREEADRFIIEYNEKLPKDSVPECYSYADTPVLVEVPEKLYDLVQEKKSMWGVGNQWSPDAYRCGEWIKTFKE
jgi:hypothetical protein